MITYLNRYEVFQMVRKLTYLMSIALTLISCGNNEKLAVYTCDPSYAAESCNNGCVLEKDFKYSFLINKEEKSVLHISYFEGDQGALTHKNCTIFDNKNWDCSEFDTLPHVSINKKFLMANGIFTDTREVRSLNNYSNLRNADEKGTCAK